MSSICQINPNLSVHEILTTVWTTYVTKYRDDIDYRRHKKYDAVDEFSLYVDTSLFHFILTHIHSRILVGNDFKCYLSLGGELFLLEQNVTMPDFSFKVVKNEIL